MAYSRKLIIILALAVLTTVSVRIAPGWALEPIPRRILALYDSRDVKDLRDSILHKSVQTVLEHLGLIVDYLDVAGDELPDDEAMSEYRGLVSLFYRTDLPRAEEFLNWLTRQVESGHRVVVLGDLGADTETATGRSVPVEAKKRFWRALGLEYLDAWTKNVSLLSYRYKDPELVEFERKYPLKPPVHIWFQLIDPQGRAGVIVSRSDIEGSDSPVVCLTSKGGMAAEGYFLFRDDESGFQQWYINPFEFFEQAFDLKGLPRVDTTTISGTRIFYSHIDGDGLTGYTELNPKLAPGDIIRDEIFKVYNLPFTASVIVGEVAPEALGSEAKLNLVRSIFALPNVEPGCHSYSHPFYWKVLADPADPSSAPEPSPYGDNLNIPNYAFDLSIETQWAMDYINRNLLPRGKICGIFQWTGDCRPTEESIALVDQAGAENINGADTVFDPVNPSISGVMPLYYQEGQRIQIYNSMANDNIFTNLWEKPFWGFRRVTLTFEKTESPRRLRPMNAYFHFFSGAKEASLNALRFVLDYVQKKEIAPIYTSHYCKIVRGFLNAKITSIGDGGFIVRDYGEARTVRFDHTDLRVDLERSTNVQGFNYYQGNLYVHLGTYMATIYLTRNEPGLPYLIKASGPIADWRCSPDEIRFKYEGWKPGKAVVQTGTPGREVKIEIQDIKSTLIKADSQTTDAKGRLVLNGLSPSLVTVRLSGL